MDSKASRHLTFLMEFHMDEHLMKTSQPDAVISPIKTSLQKHIGEVVEVYRRGDESSFACVLDVAAHHLATIRLSTPGLILLSIDVSNGNGSGFTYEASKELEAEIGQKLGTARTNSIAPIKRGGPLDRFRYLTSSDDRLLEYDVDRVVADVRSPFQHIQILHTINFGNLLVLDGYQNLAESDLVYTETLIRRGRIDYADKKVLILGAGDGALLWELLKEKPRMVTMIEIDEMVMKLCREHLRTACGTALDSYKGPNHEIIIGDCLVELDKLKESGAQFDFVFSDLTDIPLSTCRQEKEWQFLRSVMDKSLDLLAKDGRFLTHGSGVSSVQSLADFEAHLSSLVPSVKFERWQAFVPSFMEDWVFYQVTRCRGDE